MIKQFKKSRDGRKKPGRDIPKVRYEAGQKVRDKGLDRVGVILDSACQYTHPQAPPIFNYLVRWQDGQVQAVSEAAFQQGLETID
jgi:hypothetical protein